ncbi:MAG: hypothetical protein ACM3ME_10410 [Chloroflexota bacterium]
MRKFALLILAFFSVCILIAQNPDADAIRKKMAAIRQTTNWKNKEEAAKANAEINKLAKELMMTKSVPRDQVGEDGPEPGYMLEEDIDFKLRLWNELWGAFKRDDKQVDLAGTLRKDIVEDYNEDSDHTVKSQELLDNVSILTLNMSMPGIDAVINQMPYFKNIRTLVIVCQQPVPVDLQDILDKASGYPLEQLFVFNFGPMVTDIPETIGNFRKLNEISLIGNHITSLPPTMVQLPNLRKLYVSLNPVSTIVSALSPGQKMSEIALQNTNVTEEEKDTLRQMFPGCTILE